MDYGKYTYHLRIGLLPGKYEDEHIAHLVKYCKKYHFEHAMLFLNATHDCNISHITKEEAQPLVDVIKKAKAALNAEGISVGINPWSEIGNGDRPHGLRGKHTFQTLVGPTGVVSTVEACPLDPEFLDYIADLFAYYAKEIRPEILWLEDDFRMHNRPWLDDFACFCPLHMAEYCKELGFECSREQFVAGIIEENVGQNPYREAYLKVTRRAMENCAKAIGDAVRKAAPEVRVGLMTSHPEEHAIEYRDWARLFDCLDEGMPPIDRIHMPYHFMPTEFVQLFNEATVQTRARLPQNAVVLPEVENTISSPYVKSVACVRMEIEATAILAPKGVTLNVYSQDSNGILPEWGYGQEAAKILPKMQALLEEDLDFSSMDGVIVPFSTESVRYVKPKKYYKWLDYIKPDDSYFANLLAPWGVAFAYREDPIDVKGKTVAVAGQWFRQFGEEQIRAFFANNKVLLDGDSVETLVDMGLGDVAGVKSFRWVQNTYAENYAEDGPHFERAADGVKIFGRHGIAARLPLHDVADVTYDESKPRKTFSGFLNFAGVKIADGITQVGEDVFILPYRGEYNDSRMLLPLREDTTKKFLSATRPAFMTVGKMLTPYFYAANNVLLLMNFGEDDLPAWFYPPQGFTFDSLRVLRDDGTWQDAKYTVKNGKVTLTGKKCKAMTVTAVKFFSGKR